MTKSRKTKARFWRTKFPLADSGRPKCPVLCSQHVRQVMLIFLVEYEVLYGARFLGILLILSQWRSQGGGTLSECMILSSHRFDLAVSSPNLSESSLDWWATVLGFASVHPRTVRASYARTHSPHAKLDSTSLATPRRIEHSGVIES